MKSNLKNNFVAASTGLRGNAKPFRLLYLRTTIEGRLVKTHH